MLGTISRQCWINEPEMADGTYDGIHSVNDDVSIHGETTDDGITTTMLDGTELGTFVNEITATDGDDDGITYDVLGNDETHENGTATGENQLDGTETTVGA